MTRTIVLFMVLFGAFSDGFAAEFVVKSFKEDGSDLSARKYERLDANDDPCAIIKVTTDLKGLKFDSNRGVEEVAQKEGEYWVYVPPTEKMLEIWTEGFIKLSYIIPVPVKSSTVYVMVLTRKGGAIGAIDEDLFQVVFKLNETAVFISKDDGAPLKTQDKTALFSLPEGPYQFKFTKEGFADQIQDIRVEKDATVSVEMEPGTSKERMRLPGIVSINSDPAGAEVFLNDQKLGETPHDDGLMPGDYTLVLRKKFYYPHTSRFTIAEGESKQIPMIALKPRFATCTIQTTPEEADVYVDGTRLDPVSRTNQQIASGSHIIRVEKGTYHPEERTVELKDGDNKTFSFDLIPAYGKLIIRSEPEEGVAVILDGRNVGTTPYTKKTQPSGAYSVRVEKDLWLGSEKSLTVADGKTTETTFVLIKNFAQLRVSSKGAALYLNDKRMGKDAFSEKLLPGKYTVKAVKPKHHDAEKELFLQAGDEESIQLEPEPQLGSVSIISKPSDTRGARIFVDDQEQVDKPSPNVLPLLIGDYTITLKHPRYLDSSQRVSLAEREQKKLVFDMQTYTGSMLQKANRCRTRKWIGWVSGMALLGAGFYCDRTANGYYDDYQAAREIASAAEARENTERFEQYRDYSYYVSVAPLVYGIVSWARERHYEKKSR
ncbi:MAG: PEGA domain-containing protein [Candidatus Latescibacterota bacterium]